MDNDLFCLELSIYIDQFDPNIESVHSIIFLKYGLQNCAVCCNVI